MKQLIDIQHLLSESDFICFVVPSLFSHYECNALLNADIKHSFQKAITNYPSSYRNNDRLVIDSDELSSSLFSKVKPYLPETLNVDSNIKSENGIWHLKKLNNRLRFCKYAAGQYFSRHLDGVHHHSETVQSKLTFMIYLNSSNEFKGGRTLFYRSKAADEPCASYTPRKGDLIVFDHNVWHEGEQLSEGEKFVLRTDILYSKKAADTPHIPFSAHLGYIWSLLKLNKDTILSGGRDKTIRVWDLSGSQKLSLSGHSSSILCMEKIDDNTFLTGSRDRLVIVWENFKAVSIIKMHSAAVLSLCKLTACTFASAGGDNVLKIATLSGEVLKTFTGHSNWVWQVIKLNKHILATCSEDQTIKIWDTEQGSVIYTFYESCPIISLAFNAQTRQLISGDFHGNISIRILGTDFQQQYIKTFKAHDGIIRTIKIIDGIRFATGAEDNKVKIWSTTGGSLITEFEQQNFIQSIEIGDRNTLLTASYDGTIKQWHL
jgi:WD40 repeat protein